MEENNKRLFLEQIVLKNLHVIRNLKCNRILFGGF
jgi:hypothetical protein